MASDLFIGQGRHRPRLFLVLLLLFLILGTWLASAVTGADYVYGNGATNVPDDRPDAAPRAFSAQDDRCLLVAMVGEDVPQAFLLWRLRPALSAMTVTALTADMDLPDGTTLADRFGDGGRRGCEAVCDALTKARYGAPTHYIVVTATTLRALMRHLGDTLTLTVPQGWESVAGDYPGAPLTGGRQALTAEQLISFLSVPADAYPGGRAAYTRLRGDLWAALCAQFFTATRAGSLADDFAVLADAAETDLFVSHVVLYRDALTDLAAKNAGQRCNVSAPES